MGGRGRVPHRLSAHLCARTSANAVGVYTCIHVPVVLFYLWRAKDPAGTLELVWRCPHLARMPTGFGDSSTVALKKPCTVDANFVASCIMTTSDMRLQIAERKKLSPAITWKKWGEPMGARRVRPRPPDDEPESSDSGDDDGSDVEDVPQSL